MRGPHYGAWRTSRRQVTGTCRLGWAARTTKGLGVSRGGTPAGSHPKSIPLAAAGSMASGRGERGT